MDINESLRQGALERIRSPSPRSDRQPKQRRVSGRVDETETSIARTGPTYTLATTENITSPAGSVAARFVEETLRVMPEPAVRVSRLGDQKASELNGLIAQIKHRHEVLFTQCMDVIRDELRKSKENIMKQLTGDNDRPFNPVDLSVLPMY